MTAKRKPKVRKGRTAPPKPPRTLLLARQEADIEYAPEGLPPAQREQCEAGARLCDLAMGTCEDCGKAVLYRDDYLVRPELWEAAGMGGWGSGYLHRECLEERIGRKLRLDDVLAWVVGIKANGNVHMRTTAEGVALVRPN